MATENKILTAEQELKLRQPIDEYVGGIQAKIDALRVDGTDRVIDIQSTLDLSLIHISTAETGPTPLPSNRSPDAIYSGMRP